MTTLGSTKRQPRPRLCRLAGKTTIKVLEALRNAAYEAYNNSSPGEQRYGARKEFQRAQKAYEDACQMSLKGVSGL